MSIFKNALENQFIIKQESHWSDYIFRDIFGLRETDDLNGLPQAWNNEFITCFL